MRFSKYNHEGYHDPTVYEAFTGIEKERKQEKQAVKQLRASYLVVLGLFLALAVPVGVFVHNVSSLRCARLDLEAVAPATPFGVSACAGGHRQAG